MKHVLSIAALILALAGPRLSYAQAPDSGGPTPQAPTADPTQVPLDGGASLLLAGGVAYGLRKLRQRKAAR